MTRKTNQSKIFFREFNDSRLIRHNKIFVFYNVIFFSRYFSELLLLKTSQTHQISEKLENESNIY
jgi:hypothetical protein